VASCGKGKSVRLGEFESVEEIRNFTEFRLFDLILSRVNDLGIPLGKTKRITVVIHYVNHVLFNEEVVSLRYKGLLWDLRDIDKAIPGYSEWLDRLREFRLDRERVIT
jgi:hypothetical protein